MRSEFFECECSSRSHVLKVTTDDDADEPCVIVSAHLNNYLRWYERLYVGTRFILGMKETYDHFDDFWLKQTDAPRIVTLLRDHWGVQVSKHGSVTLDGISVPLTKDVAMSALNKWETSVMQKLDDAESAAEKKD